MKKVANPWYYSGVPSNGSCSLDDIAHEFILLTGKWVGDKLRVVHDHGVYVEVEIKRVEGRVWACEGPHFRIRNYRYWTHFYVEGDSDEEDS